MKIRNYNKKDKTAVQDIFAKYWTDKEFLDELEENLDNDKVYFYVAEKDNEIVGVAGFREALEHLRVYAETKNPAELYIIASKEKSKGTGNILAQEVIKKAKGLDFTEIECYSPETHNSSWRFYEKLGFTKYGIINDPDDGYPGMLWIKII
jgi:N-acetylglutamate synthase-like GNAT family acetyltransferase